MTDGGFVNNKELFGDKVWVPNADGGYMPVDPSLVTTTYGGKPVVDPRILLIIQEVLSIQQIIICQQIQAEIRYSIMIKIIIF